MGRKVFPFLFGGLFVGLAAFVLGFASPAFAALDCSGAKMLKSGDTVSGDTTGGASTASLYSCTSWDESGPEHVFTITTTTTGDLKATLSNLLPGVDLDVFILSACDETACKAYGDTEAVLSSAPPSTYYVVVDGYMGAEGTYNLTVTGLCEGVDCDDGDACTEDTCDPALGVCNHVPLCPEVLSMTPAQGAPGTTVTITGNRFQSGIQPIVSFNGIPATLSTWSPTSITCTVPVGASTGCVTVANEHGVSECVGP